MRYSKQRELVLNILKSNYSHPTAAEVYEIARKTEPSISLGTVYRNLNELCVNNLIRQIKTNDDKIHYDGNIKLHNHFVCRCCNAIIDTEPLNPANGEIDGNEIDDMVITYYGKCRNCKNKNNIKGD